MSIKVIKIGDVDVYVEVDEVKHVDTEVRATEGDDYTPVAHENFKPSFDQLKDTIRELSTGVHSAFGDVKPDEFEVEMSFGFAGEMRVPFLASSKASAAVKIKALWKNTSKDFKK